MSGNLRYFISMTRTKIIAKIPCQLMNKDQAVALKLEEQPYLAFIPKSLLQKQGFTEDEFSLDLLVEGNKIFLETSV